MSGTTKPKRFTQSEEQILRELKIDREQPGAILQDFTMLLEFVGDKGVKAAGKYNLLPINAISELDSRLRRPVKLQMQRPQLRSHPYLLGLHLLFRATGLGRVDGRGEKARLVVDATLRDRWNNLNSTEQYFTLLEAWLLYSTNAVFGERDHWGTGPLMECLQCWQSLQTKHRRFDLERPHGAYLYGIMRSFQHLALMDLFGLLEVEFPDRPVKPWCPASVTRLPLGDGVFFLLDDWFSETGIFEIDNKIDRASPPKFGYLQHLFTPYVPEWRNNLILDSTRREGTFVFEVSLGQAVRRRIAIGDDNVLDDLAQAILQSVNFDNDHLYDFRFRDCFGGRISIRRHADETDRQTDDYSIGELPLPIGRSMTFVFDYGDSWQFDVKLEAVEPERRAESPLLLDQHGAAPEQYQV